MKKNKRKIILVISILLIITIVVLGLIYFNTNNINMKIQGTQKEYNAELQENEHMHLEEDASGDKIPVPNGYVGSKVAGENEIDTGYVIYEGEEEVTDENVEEAQKTRNQYVWVPVPDASKMYGIDENGKKWGKLYEFTTETGENIDEETGAKPLNWTESDGVMKVLNANSNKEPSILSNYAIYNFDMDSKVKSLELGIDSNHGFLIQLEQEFNTMIESIKKYRGFYVGRYETGNLQQEVATVIKGNTNIGNKNWYNVYNKCKTLKADKTNIETGIIWGCQWDRILMWLIESKNKSKEEIINSTSWGNYNNVEFEYIDSKGDRKIKKLNESIQIPTGSSEYTRANNIYDLGGNIYESTMEAFSYYFRVYRGGYFDLIYNEDSSSYRYGSFADSTRGYFRLPSNAIYKIMKIQ